MAKGEISNNGVIKGSKFAVNGDFNTLTNNGILAGQKKIDNTYNRNGIEIILNSEGEVINIENGSGGDKTLEDGMIKNIINGEINGLDSYVVSEDGNRYKNNIINGAGINKGALTINGKITTLDSIINGYNTAIYLEDGSELTATNTIFNGGGLKNNIDVIKGDSGDNIASILGNSIINGAVDLGDGDDILSIENNVQINGNIDGGDGDDTLNLGNKSLTKSDSNLNIFNEINGFETINTNGNITLFETAKISSGDITLQSGNLTLRIDPTQTNSKGEVIGHALYNHSGLLNTTGGNLIIGANGLGEGTIISMNNTILSNGEIGRAHV